MRIKNVVLQSILIITVLTSCSDEINSSSEGAVNETVTNEQNNERDANDNTAAPAEWKTYRNDRFNFCFNFPEDQFQEKGNLQTTDGSTFVSNDGNVEIKVYGYHNVLEQSTKEMYAADVRNNPEKKVRKEDVQPNWYMISGDKNGKYFIEKRVVQNGEVKVVEVVMPHEQGQEYQQVVNDALNAFPICSK